MSNVRQLPDTACLEEVVAHLDDLLLPDVIDEVYDLWVCGEVDYLLPDLVQYIFERADAAEGRAFPRW